MMNQQFFYPITEKSQVGEARRRTGEVVEHLGFDQTTAEKVAIVVTELATNLLKHAGEGELVVRPLHTAQETGIEILALDRGPGMANVATCLRDGYSTSGSLGQGLGAVQRLSTHLAIYSTPGAGTALLAQVWSQPLARPSTERFVYGAICRPKPGETANGDGWAVHSHADGCTLLMCDGLGHGPEAAAATRKAIKTVLAQPTRSVTAHLENIHAALRSTRGASVAVVAVTLGKGVDFVGIGNISGCVLLETGSHHLLSQNGIAGHQARKIQPFFQPWTSAALLVLHSDGLNTRWALGAYPGLRQCHPSLIAGVLYRDFRRGNDDVTVVVVKEVGK